MTQLEQLQMIVDCLCFGKKAELQRRLGMPNGSTITGWFQRGNFDIRRIATAFPELSIDWLVFGIGPMFKADCRAEGYVTQSQDDINPDAPAQPTVNHSEGETRAYADNNNEQPSSDAPLYTVREGEAVDRAMLNYLLRELASRDQRIAILEQRNLALERDNAVMSDRLQNAETWYRQNIQNKKG